MILGQKEIQKLIKSNKLVENLSKREKNDPEGCVIDLRLDKVLKLKGKAFLGIDDRETPDVEEVAGYDSQKRSSFIFKPGDYYLTKTMERVNLTENIGCVFKPRSTTFRSGLVIRTGVANPGYCGDLFFGLYNAGSIEVEIELGARYVSAIFFETKGDQINTYRGQWQGGRDTTTGREKQI